jgi:hypothetical protein
LRTGCYSRSVLGEELRAEFDQLGHAGVGRAVVGVAAASAHVYEPATDKAGEVRRDAPLGEPDVGHAVVAGPLPFGAEGQQGEPGRVTEGAEEAG